MSNKGLGAPIPIKAVSSIILDAYADGTEAKLNPSTVEKQLQEAIGPELLTGDGHWPGHATILLALGNPTIAENHMDGGAWKGTCQVVADYLVRRFIPIATAINGRYEHSMFGRFTLPELALLPAIVAARENEMRTALDTYAPEWRTGIDQLWRDGPERVFHSTLSHLVIERMTPFFTGWLASSLSIATRMSDAEIAEHILILAKDDKSLAAEALFKHLRNSSVHLLTRLPGEANGWQGETVGDLLNVLAKRVDANNTTQPRQPAPG